MSVGDVSVDKVVVRLPLELTQLCCITSIGKGVKVYDLCVRVFIDHQTDEMRSYKTRASCD